MVAESASGGRGNKTTGFTSEAFIAWYEIGAVVRQLLAAVSQQSHFAGALDFAGDLALVLGTGTGLLAW